MSLLTELRRSLQALAAPASQQLDLFPELEHTADALAFDFDHWRDVVTDATPDGLTSDQARALAELDAQLIAMGATDEPLWTESALRESPLWERVRQLARAALSSLGWEEAPAAPSDD